MSVDLISRKTITTKLLSEKTVFKMLTDKLLSSVAVIISLARTLVKNEANALSIDFTDSFFSSTGQYGSAYVKDTGTPANDYDSTPYGLLTYTSPSLKMTRGPDGLLRFGAHNLCLYSETFGNGSYTYLEVSVTADAIAAPNGAVTADKIVPSTNKVGHAVFRGGITGSTGFTYTATIRAKAAGYNWIGLSDATTGQAVFNLTTGAVESTDAGITANAAEDLGDGWWLCSIQYTASSARGIGFDVWSDAGKTAYAGDGALGVYIWGAQLRRTPSDDTYLATTSAARYALPYEWDVNGDLLGLLVEEQRTNLRTQSENFSGDVIVAASITANATSAPDGLTTAAKLVENTANRDHYAYQPITTTAAAHTFSVYLKPAGRSWALLFLGGGSNCSAYFDLSGAGAVGTVSGSFSGKSASIAALPNGWYRCVVTATCTSSSQPTGVALATSDSTSVYTGDGSSGLYIWGAQLEVGSFPTSYIPTLGSTVTRAADNITLATSAFPYLQTASSLAIEYDFIGAGTSGPPYAIALDNGASLSVFAGIRHDVNVFNTDSGGAITISPSLNATGDNYVAFAQASNDRAVAANGNAANTSVAAYTPGAATTLSIGLLGNMPATYGSTMRIKRVLYVPRRVSNADLQTLTLTGQLP